MRIAMMQPYFFPYIGYFQLMNSVDEFVVYDNIQFTKKGWISRNRILVNGSDAYISLTLKKDSDFLNVDQRYLADTWPADRKKILNRITESYRKAPYFKEVYPLIETCILHEELNLFKFIFNSLIEVKNYLEIKTKLTISSEIEIDHELKSENKVMAICNAKKANIYINPIGGLVLYDKERFIQKKLILQFLKSDNIIYPQLNNEFIPFLSVIDFLMFNSKVEIIEHLKSSLTLH